MEERDLQPVKDRILNDLNKKFPGVKFDLIVSQSPNERRKYYNACLVACYVEGPYPGKVELYLQEYRNDHTNNQFKCFDYIDVERTFSIEFARKNLAGFINSYPYFSFVKETDLYPRKDGTYTMDFKLFSHAFQYGKFGPLFNLYLQSREY